MKFFIKTIEHKWFVFLVGIKLHVPLYLLILHDWSKFLWCELPHYQKQFFGDANDPLGFSYAWNHHQKCNKHHWEYWIPITQHHKGGCLGMTPLPMPRKYVLEMIADWCSSYRCTTGRWPEKNWAWWEGNKDKILSGCHKDTISMLTEYMRRINVWVK